MWLNFIKKTRLTLVLILLASIAYAEPPSQPPLNVREEDGSPSSQPTRIIRVPNSTLTVNSNGDVSLNYAASADLANYLKLDQNEPQTVINGTPTFSSGIYIGANQSVQFGATMNQRIVSTETPSSLDIYGSFSSGKYLHIDADSTDLNTDFKLTGQYAIKIGSTERMTIGQDVSDNGYITQAFGSLSITGSPINLESQTILDATNTEAFLVRTDSDAGDVLAVDTTNSRVTIGVPLTIPSGLDPQLYLPMVADQSILIDGSTNNRLVDSGVMRFLHTPAIENTRTITYVVDANSMTNTHATVAELTATGLASGEQMIGHDIQMDTADSTGGIISALEVSRLGSGSATTVGLKTSSGITAVYQNTGTFGNVEQAWDYNGAYTDVTASFNSAASDATLFDADNDVVYIGMAAQFDAISVTLATVASNPGIKPTFEFSAGGGLWTVFTPSDDTLGFRTNGLIWWTIADIPTWATDTVNGVGSKYWVRITRTQNVLSTAPVEDLIQVQTSIVYQWDENGDLVVNSVDAGQFTLGDNEKLLLGDGQDASIYYDGSDMVFNSREVGTGDFYFANGNVGIGTASPTAVLHLKAGTATASTAPLKFTSGTLNTTAEAGAVEFLTDKYYGTITTGAARKEFTLNDSALTPNYVPVATTNGRLTSIGPAAYTILQADSGYMMMGTNLSGTFSAETAGTVLRLPTSGTFGISNNGTSFNLLKITNAGNVGIGETSPDLKLHVTETAAAIVAKFERVDTGTTNVTGVATLWHTTSGNMADGFGGSLNYAIEDGGASATIASISGIRDGGDTSGALLFNTASAAAPSEKMRLNTYGNLGIGLSPSYRLDVEQTAAAVTARLARSDAGTTTSVTPLWINHKTSGNMADGFGSQIGFTITDGGASDQSLGAVGAVRAGADNTGDLFFTTWSAGSATEKMRITSGGNVKIPNDSTKLYFGAGDDASIEFDGTDWNLRNEASDSDITIDINDGGVQRTAIQVNGDEGSVTMPRQSYVRANRDSTTGDQVIAAATWTTVIFDEEVTDVLGEYNTSTGEFTAKDAGVYMVCTHISWKSLDQSKIYRVGIAVNDEAAPSMQADNYTYNAAGGQSAMGLPLTHALKLNAGDKVEIMVYQSTAGNESLTGAADAFNVLTITKVS